LNSIYNFETASKVFRVVDDIIIKRVQRVHAASLISLDLGRLIRAARNLLETISNPPLADWPNPIFEMAYSTCHFLYQFFHRFKYFVIFGFFPYFFYQLNMEITSVFQQNKDGAIPSQRRD